MVPNSVKIATRRAVRWSATPTGLAWLFIAGLVIRLVLARGGGLPFDIPTFAAWADKLATGGLADFYPKDPGPDSYFIDYPPGYMYVLFVLGKISRALSGGAPSTFLVKVPPILADLGLAGVVTWLASKLTPRSLERDLPWRGVAAAAILLNPAIFFVSATWGQADSIQALLVLGGFALLIVEPRSLRRDAAGLAVLALALATKPQAVFVIPFAVLILVWRHVRGGDVEGRAGVFLGLVRVAGLGLFALGFVLAIMAPFGMGVDGWIRFYAKASGTYPFTSVWAFNLWGAIGFWKRDIGKCLEFSEPLSKCVRYEEPFMVFGVPALYVGLAALAVGTFVLLFRAWRALQRGEHDGRVLVFGGAALTCLAFAVVTRIHERYLFLALAALAPLVAYRSLRRSLILLSALYFANVHFAYVYHVESQKRKAVHILPYQLAFGGGAGDSAQKKILSLVTGLVCIGVAWAGWRWMQSRRLAGEEEAERALEPEDVPEAAADEPALPQPRRRWSLELHPVGRRGAALAAVTFILVAITRLVGLGSPPGMYFDEVYHARTAGEYLQGKEVYEWTHPPLAKQIMGFFIKNLSGFGVHGRAVPPPGLGTGIAFSDGERVVWGTPSRALTGTVSEGRFDDACGVVPVRQTVTVSVVPTVVSTADGGTIAGGIGADGAALVRVQDGKPTWSVPLPARPASLAVLGADSFVVAENGALLRIGADGTSKPIAEGAAVVVPAKEDALVWASFPDGQKVVAYAQDGAERFSVGVSGRPRAIAVSMDSDRLLAADGSSPRIELVDTEAKTRDAYELAGASPTAFGQISETALVWAAAGNRLRIIEPRGFAVIGATTLPAPALALLDDREHTRLVAVTKDGLACVSGNNTFAWRFGGAIWGAAMAAMVVLIVLRLFGSIATAALAALFLTVDGLAFVMARIAMNDSYVTAFILAAWFAALSAIYHRKPREDGGPPRRAASMAWFFATGAFMGLGIASKWVAVYASAGIVLLYAWDLRARGRDGIGGLAGHPLTTVLLAGVALGAVPIGIYLASYLPYFHLQHGFMDLVRLQKGMYDYHAHLTATHPYGSPWYGWPVGHKAVWLYLGTHGQDRAEIWTVGNPIVFIGGLVGMATLASAAWRRRAAAAAVPVAAALVQYLPWVTVTRVTFLYHYLPTVPFLSIALAWWITIGRKGTRRRNLEIVTVAVAAVAAFALTLPMIDGWFVSPSYLQAVKAWLSWMF